ncbi:MAG: hypothetical protein FJ034_07445 [Chloroflexi bacterium]|nr:hypothetical protein [Chloroflexota bacterium]
MIVPGTVVLVVLTIAVTFFITASFVGRRLPRAHRVVRSARYAEPIARVWQVVSDPNSARSFGVARIEQAIPVPGRVLIRRISGERQFGGSWTYELEPDGSGTRLTITEEGEVFDPFLRFLVRFVIGQHRTIDRYLETLRRTL